jgi:hypothetical protein
MSPSREHIYQIGRIYKVFSNVDDNYYWGSTGGKLSYRKSQHLSRATQGNAASVFVWMRDIGYDNVRIETIEQRSNITRGDLEKIEDEYIKKSKDDKDIYCLNAARACRPQKEYMLEHLQEKRDYDKQYYLKNSEKCKQRAREWLINNRDKCRATRKQYAANNKQEKIEYDKRYRLDPAVKARATERIECPICKQMVRKFGLNRHQKAQKCRSSQ